MGKQALPVSIFPYTFNIRKEYLGNSLAVQWLGAFTAVAWVQSLVGELRSCKTERISSYDYGRLFKTPNLNRQSNRGLPCIDIKITKINEF